MLDDPRSNRVKGIVRLNQKDARYETGLFLLEGPQGLKELEKSPRLIEEVFVTSSAWERYREILAGLSDLGVAIEEVTDEVMSKISDTRTPQGVVAVVHHLDIELDKLLSTKPVLLALIDQGRDPGNLGSIIRAADAAGADAVILSPDSVDVYNPKVVRSTAGSILNVPIVVAQDLVEAISKIKASGIQVFSSSSSGQDVTEVSVAEMAKPTAWVFGNEAHGVTDEVAKKADKTMSLPIYGAAESLNLGIAASICLYLTAVAQHTNR